VEANEPRPHLCSRCGGITERAEVGPDGRGEGACPDCGLGFSSVAMTATFSRTEGGPLRAWRARRRSRRHTEAHRSRQADIIRCRTFPIHGLDDRWTGSRWIGGWGTSNDEVNEIGLAHGDLFDETAAVVRVVTWRLAPPMEPLTVANAAQGLAHYLWQEADAPHDLIRPAYTSDDPTAAWSELALPVDGSPTGFRSLAHGDHWVALVRTEGFLVGIEARHIDPGDVGLVTVHDDEVYLAETPTPH
jgi:hypothetical protein